MFKGGKGNLCKIWRVGETNTRVLITMLNNIYVKTIECMGTWVLDGWHLEQLIKCGPMELPLWGSCMCWAKIRHNYTKEDACHPPPNPPLEWTPLWRLVGPYDTQKNKSINPKFQKTTMWIHRLCDFVSEVKLHALLSDRPNWIMILKW